MIQLPAKTSLRAAIIDGYLDEPSCLGVPPYISPHVRYIYGALLLQGLSPEQIDYFLIDQVRQDKEQILESLERTDLVIIIAGTTVPGKYLGGRPASLKELLELGENLERPFTILGGPVTQSLPARWSARVSHSFDLIAGEIAPLTVTRIMQEEDPGQGLGSSKLREYIRDWAIAGSSITRKHPSFPHLVCELETFRGCLRPVNCSFCSERLKKMTYCRQPQDVVEEVAALYSSGNRYFRLGCQTDLIAYGGHYEGSTLIPNPAIIRQLYQGIAEAAPALKVLHMDNANPVSLAANPELAEEILEIITNYNTPGDVAAFGLESADPAVLKENNINAAPEQVFQAIRLMNKVGGKRSGGIPRLLPGLNFLHGLAGESKMTMEHNYQFLKKVLAAGLLLRRINIRQVQEIGNYRGNQVNKYRWQKYKEQINQEINLPMLRRVFPRGTILREVLTEKQEGKITFGRQLGTYPILVGIPGQHEPGQFIDVVVTGHGYRSLTGLPYPFPINRASLIELEALPGIGKKRAMRIFMNRPIKGPGELQQILDNGYDLNLLADWVVF